MRIFYLRDSTGLPVICVASELRPDNQVEFAVTTYNPRDDFDKDRMRHIAEQRLKKGKVFKPIPLDAVPTPERGLAVKLRIVREIAENDEKYEVRDRKGNAVVDSTGNPVRKRVIPHRAKFAAQLWLEQLAKKAA